MNSNEIIFTSIREPRLEDCNEYKQVEVWNIDECIWEYRFAFDFPSHPLWSEADRREIQRKWPKWRRIENVNDYCELCEGDGIERCTNPDHCTSGELGRLGCPCCGYDPDHKIHGEMCSGCSGTGYKKEKLPIEILHWNAN